MPSTSSRSPSSCIWIPPPALTSRHRRSASKTDKSILVTSKKDTKMKEGLDIQLAAVLKDIDTIKDELLKNFTGNILCEDQQKLSMDKPVRMLQNIEEEKSKIEQALQSIKHELQLKAEENIYLSKQQDVLNIKLKSIEESASEAMKSIIPIGQYIKKLKAAKDERYELGEKYLQDIISKLFNLVNMNQTVLNSVTANTEEPESPTTNKDLQVNQLKEEIDRLKMLLNEDRRKITDLQKVARDRSAHEKEKDRNAIRIQKDRANKYLAIIEQMKAQIYQKNLETDQLGSQINSLQLQNSQFKSEKDRLEIEKNTLECNLTKVVNENYGNKMEVVQLEELSSKLSQAMINIDHLGTEKLNLKANLAKSDNEIQQLKLELEHLKTTMREMPNKNTQTSVVKIKDEDDDEMRSKLGLDLWQELQKDKEMIMQSLQSLEKKLEVSQQTNFEFKNEILSKDEALQHIHNKLQDKMQENKTLRELLESALVDVRKYTTNVDQKASLTDQTILIKINELERMVDQYKLEKEQLKREMLEMETKYKAQIDEISERLELAEKAKNTMHEYVKFLKASYASVFGDL